MIDHDPVNSPSYYTRGGVEVFDAIDAWGLNYYLGTVLKYIVRAGHKEDELQDLKKARRFLERAIKNVEGQAEPPSKAWECCHGRTEFEDCIPCGKNTALQRLARSVGK